VRILLATSRFPWPARRGNQLRTLQIAAWLAERHEVAVLAPRPLDERPVPPGLPFEVKLHPVRWRARFAAAGRALRRGWPLQHGLYDLTAVAAAARGAGREPDLVVLQLSRMQGALREVGGLPMAIDFVDSLSLNFARRAARDRVWLRPFWSLEARLLARSERLLLGHARFGLVVCERDRAAIVRVASAADGERLHVLPVAMEPVPAARAEPARARVVLTGNLGYFPTVDGALFLAREVWPKLRREVPAAELVMAGARAPRRLRDALADCGGRLVDAPADLGAVLGGATVAVAPLFAGSGVPIKILEAWRAGVPVVTTPYAAAGTTGVVGRDFAVAEAPGEWARTLVSLLGDPAARAALAAGGRARLADDYAPGALSARLLDLVEASASATVEARR
jgi:glycosyltransferase involved in cell wall biosynthesis